MSDTVDLRAVLQGWPYDPANNLRIVRGEDGREILQVRLPLGVEQFEMTGRPDGQRPYGHESVLDYHLARLARLQAGGEEASFTLQPEQCAELFDEGTLYYLRYLHCFQLRRFADTVRDTERNLKLFDFVRKYAARAEDQLHLEKWRPYIVRMNAAARAMLELERRNHARALEIVHAARQQIESLKELDDETFRFERRRSLAVLRGMAAEIERTRPVSPVERLERELKQAVAAEEFERAAELRDRLRALRAQGATGGDRAAVHRPVVEPSSPNHPAAGTASSENGAVPPGHDAST